MADVITRFKLETSQYDSKLRDASKALAEIGKEAMDAGKDFDKFTKESIESAKALGSIATSANTTKGKVQELVGAYNDVAKAYNKLTEDQKQSDFGKAMAGSLQELQGRIKQAKSELYGLGDSGKNTGGIMSQLADKFTINIDALKLFNMGLQASKAALGVAKDALFQSESNIDEWGRTVEGAKGAYSTFINTLNTGNWSNFFSNLATAVQGARDLYDALDRLGSIKANNAAAIAIVQQQIAQLRLAKQNGENVDEQLKAATERLRALQNQSVFAGQTAGTTSIINTLRNRVNAGNTVGVNIDEGTFIQLAYELTHSGQAVFDSMKKTFTDLAAKATVESQKSFTNQYGGTSYYASTSIDLSKLTAEEQKQYIIAKAITDGETEIQKGISLFAQAITEGTAAAREEFKGNRYALQGAGGSGGKGGSGDTPAPGSINAMKKHIQELQEAFNEATDQGVRDGLRTAINEANTELARMSGTLPAEGSIEALRAKVKELQDEFNKTADQSIRGQLLVAIDEAQKKLDFMSGKGVSLLERQNTSLTEHLGLGFDAEKLKKDINPVDFDNSKIVEAIVEQWTKQLDRESNNEQRDEIITTIGKLKGALGNVVSGLKSIGIELPEEVNALLSAIQGVGQIISSVGAIIELVSATSETANTSAILANTSALIALTTAMTTNSFLSLIPFARGGIVRAAGGTIIPGNSYSGDNLRMPIIDSIGGWAGVNSGELILNRSQQGVLAASLQDQAAGRSQNLLAKVKGTDLIVMLDRTGRMTGKGELAFWKD